MQTIILSLYDPKLDSLQCIKKEPAQSVAEQSPHPHPGNKSLQKGTNNPKKRAYHLRETSPCLEMVRCQAYPTVARVFLLVEKGHEAGAKHMAELLDERIKKIAAERTNADFPTDKTAPWVELRVVEYRDLWDTTACVKNIRPIVEEVISRYSDHSLAVNLGSGTAAARAALYLCSLDLLKKRADASAQGNAAIPAPSGCVVKFGVDGRVSETLDILDPHVPVGILKDLMGTSDPVFVSTLGDLERLLRSARHERILLTGPTGAGKSHLADEIIRLMQTLDPSIHDTADDSSNVIRQNVAAIARNLMESTLFGHEKGAYTGAGNRYKGIFERANGGIVFLDEIGELPLHLQAKLLTVLDGQPFERLGGTQPIRTRFTLICGTNKDLEEECREGRFRRDLFQRISTWTFHVPGLRDRPSDFEYAIQVERGLWRNRFGQEILIRDSPGSKSALEKYLSLAKRIPWDGNFREFHAAFVHMAFRAENGDITSKLIEEELGGKLKDLSDTASWQNSYDLADLARLACALDACKGAKSAAVVGKRLFESRSKSPGFNGSATIQRLFKDFGLEITFEHGTARVTPLKQTQPDA